MSTVNAKLPFPTDSDESESTAVILGLWRDTRAWRSIFALQEASRIAAIRVSGYASSFIVFVFGFICGIGGRIHVCVYACRCIELVKYTSFAGIMVALWTGKVFVYR